MRDPGISHWQTEGRQEVCIATTACTSRSWYSSKRSGLEKAIYQVEEAIKKRKSDAPSHKHTLEQLQKLLNDAKDEDSSPPSQTPGLNNASDPFTFDAKDMKPPVALQHSEREHVGGPSDDQLAVEDVENPLQLLARASGTDCWYKEKARCTDVGRSPHYIATCRREQHLDARE